MGLDNRRSQMTGVVIDLNQRINLGPYIEKLRDWPRLIRVEELKMLLIMMMGDDEVLSLQIKRKSHSMNFHLLLCFAYAFDTFVLSEIVGLNWLSTRRYSDCSPIYGAAIDAN